MMKKLWGERFREEIDQQVFEFSKSIEYDFFLFEYLARLNISYSKALEKAGILRTEERRKVVKAIEKFLDDFYHDKLEIDFESEDIHSFFYQVLETKIGNLVNKLHAGKSRNDEIVQLERMFLKDVIAFQSDALTELQGAILKKAIEYKNCIIPGFTHLQFAQPILLAHLFLSWIEELERDKERLYDLLKRVDILAIGSSALAGTSIPIDRQFLAKELGFGKIGNSIDMVSDRDFILEYLAQNAILALHLSRYCEDLIIYNSPGYGFIQFEEWLLTGSSIMPQKKNPDSIELVRASCAELVANFDYLAIVFKALPFSYNRDLQFDKVCLLRSCSTIADIISVMIKVFSALKIDQAKLEALLKDEGLYLTDIAEELMLKGLSWKQARECVSQILRLAEDKGISIKNLDKKILDKILSGRIGDIESFFNPRSSALRKKTKGGTNPREVNKALIIWRRKLKVDA